MSELATRVLGSKVVSSSAVRMFAGTRVVACHDVPSADRFEANLRAMLQWCDPVDPTFAAATASDTLRRRRPRLLVTFDDGHASVVQHALPVLLRHGVRAVMFVSPGLASGDRAFWWDVAACAEAAGYRDRLAPHLAPDLDLVAALKRIPDVDRRTVIAKAMDIVGSQVPRQAATPEQLRSWLDAGMTLGNHTWDHPCLDQCDDLEQHHQVQAAHDWLEEFVGAPPRIFAYPNGDWTRSTEVVLAELGYDAAYLFDHRVDRSTHPLRRSRLRLDADTTTERTRAIVSGAHSAAFGLRRRRNDRPQPSASAS